MKRCPCCKAEIKDIDKAIWSNSKQYCGYACKFLMELIEFFEANTKTGQRLNDLKALSDYLIYDRTGHFGIQRFYQNVTVPERGRL